MIRGAITVDTERCKGCNLCVVACPKGVLAIDVSRVNRYGHSYVSAVNSERCTGCASCGMVCPDGCITVYRKKE